MDICKKLLLLLIVMSLSACASIMRGRTQDFTVNTFPAGALVKLSSGQECVSPCTISKSRHSNFKVNITKNGYQNIDFEVANKPSKGGTAWYVSNIFVSGVIGMAIDAVNGATQELTPGAVEITLKKDKDILPADASEIPWYKRRLQQ